MEISGGASIKILGGKGEGQGNIPGSKNVKKCHFCAENVKFWLILIYFKSFWEQTGEGAGKYVFGKMFPHAPCGATTDGDILNTIEHFSLFIYTHLMKAFFMLI